MAETGDGRARRELRDRLLALMKKEETKLAEMLREKFGDFRDDHRKDG